MMGVEELAAVERVLASGHLVSGVETEAFENELATYLGAKHVIAVSNGSVALNAALQALPRIDGKDEVIVPSFTFNATCTAPLAAGYRPVFVDIDPYTLTISLPDVLQAITKRTVAVIPVHLYGLMADMTNLAAALRDTDIAIIEDASQAHSSAADGFAPGAFSQAATFSFYATKNMTTGGEGGAIATNDADYAATLRLLRQHGSQERYRHERHGYNYRMTEMQAAIGREQLKKLPGWQAARLRHAEYYHETLNELVDMQFVPKGYLHSWHQFTILIDDRDKVAAALKKKGIGTGIHYPMADDRQPYIGSRRAYNRADIVARDVLSIPVGPWVTPEDAIRVVKAVTAAV